MTRSRAPAAVPPRAERSTVKIVFRTEAQLSRVEVDHVSPPDDLDAP